jgi:hypothetical protein
MKQSRRILGELSAKRSKEFSLANVEERAKEHPDAFEIPPHEVRYSDLSIFAVC